LPSEGEGVDQAKAGGSIVKKELAEIKQLFSKENHGTSDLSCACGCALSVLRLRHNGQNCHAR